MTVPARATPSIVRRPGLDGVRGLAVVAVVVHHLHPDVLPGGFLGVDLFFVLSGYLITSLLLGELGTTDGVRLSGFWARRARRLLPALYLLLIGVSLAGHWLVPAWQRAAVRGDAWAALLYVSNWRYIAQGTSYFGATAAPSPLLHLWSLAIEEQAYVVWPIVVWLAWRFGGRRASTVGVVAAVGAVASAISMAVTGPGDTAYFASHTRVQAILIGAVAAVFLPMAGRRSPRAALACGGVGLAVLGVMAVVVDGTDAWMYRGGFTLAAVAGVAIAVASTTDGPFARGIGVAPLGALGAVSYGLYLVHWPVIVFCTPGRMHVDGLALDAVRLAIIAVLTIASYRLVEQPVRHGRLTTATAHWATPAAVAVVVLAVATLGIGVEPVPTYLASDAGSRAVTTVPPLPPTTTPSFPPTTVPAGSTVPARGPTTSTTAPKAPLRRITLVGDSVAASLFPGLRDAAAAQGVQVVNRASPGCGIVTNSVPAGADGTPIDFVSACRSAIAKVQAVAATDGSDLIVLLSTWEAGDRRAGAVHLVPGKAAWKASIEAGLRETVARVGAGGAKVMVLGAAPIVDGLVRTVDPTTRRLNTELVALERTFTAADGLGWVDLGPIVCSGDGADCPPEWRGTRLRPDDGAHFSPDGAHAIGPSVFAAIAAARP